MNTGTPKLLIGSALFLSLAIRAAFADTEVADQAKLAQNPIADVISAPFQNNTNLNVGPERGALNILNVQPVVPVHLNRDWNIITRTILPVISSPAPAAGAGRTSGTGDLIFTAFLSPARSGGWLWGAGPAMQAPTHSDAALGNDNWGLGPSFVVLHIEKGSQWVYGALVYNIWSVSNSGSPAYNDGLVQLFVNYNMRDGWYLTSAPIITVDWAAPGSRQWTVPVGGGLGKIVHWDRLPVSVLLAGYYNVARANYAPNWQIRTQVQFLFPK